MDYLPETLLKTLSEVKIQGTLEITSNEIDVDY